MKLRDRVGFGRKPATPTPGFELVPSAPARPRWTAVDRTHQDLKLRIHRELLDRIDVNNLARVGIDQAAAELKSVIRKLIDEQVVPLSEREREQLCEEILHEVNGLGPIEPLTRDPEVSDILVNTASHVYVE